jgi:hypothetical protein
MQATQHENDALLRRMVAHLRRHVGPVEQVFCTPSRSPLHIDILHVPPMPWRRCHTLVTCGMSLRPMRAPAGLDDCRHAELFLSLPPEWRVGIGPIGEEDFWPFRELARLAHFPHERDTWIWFGHTFASSDPDERITPGAGFTGWILGPHLSLGHDGCVLRHRRREIVIHSMMPLYREEIELAHQRGVWVLFDLLCLTGVSELIDVLRPRVTGGRTH